jgi:hypothetical protein
MPERNWGRITDGATFEALATTLVFFEDARAALFGRRGRDGGQDSRSGDGTRVFQAKHHESGSSARAIADAKAEATKIKEYRDAAHVRATQWQGVTDWRLVTNATFNPTDHQRWLDEVVPLFAAQGLRADYWERVHLDALLDRHPEVSRSFFGDEPRAFLTLPELRERLIAEQPFRVHASPLALHGRDQELARVQAFLGSNDLFLVVHGAGGIGKSRILAEAGDVAIDAGWQVLSANLATIATGGSWYDAIVPERSTVVLVDEPDDEQVLRLLSEQLGGRVGRAARWKVIISVRSPKDPVLRFLANPRLASRVQSLPLERLSREAAIAMCEDLLQAGPLAERDNRWRTEAASRLAERFGRHPIWITLAVSLLETEGDLTRVPNTAAELADRYLNEIVGQHAGQDPNAIRRLMRWIALAGTVNRENDGTMRLIAEGAGIGDPTTVLGVIAQLVQRRALIQRGANNRLVELKPDVLRDHVLREWLVVPVGFGTPPFRASPEVATLLRQSSDAITQGGLSAIGRAVLISVARTELLFRLEGEAVSLLAPFFDVIRQTLPALRPSSRIALAEVLVDLAPFRVADTAALIRELRTSVSDDESVETMFGQRVITYDDVILELGWPVYHAAFGAQTPEERVAVLSELHALAELEATVGARRRGGLPNDGRRSASLVGRTLNGGPHFWSDFDDAVETLGLRELDRLHDAPTHAQAEALRALVVPALALERQQTWFEDNHFIFRKYVITEQHPGWSSRTALIKRIRDLLEDDALPSPSRSVLWGLLVTAHQAANYVVLQGPDEFHALIRDAFLAELNWAHGVLRRRDASIEEMKAARELWDWHLRFEEHAAIKSAAERLEQLYTSDELAKEFEPFMEFLDSIEATERRSSGKADQLVAAGGAAIDAFVDRSLRFFNKEGRFSVLLGVAYQLGLRADDQPIAGDFVTRTLRTQNPHPQRLEFALRIATSWFHERRRTKSADDAFALREDLLAACRGDEMRVRLLEELYGIAPPTVRGETLSSREVISLRSQHALFERVGRLPAFVALISRLLQREWDLHAPLVERIVRDAPEPIKTEVVASLIEGVFSMVYKRERSAFPPQLNRWLLDQVICVADFDDLNSMQDWKLGEVIKILGRVPLEWLPAALRTRAELEGADEAVTVSALSHDMVLSDFVDPIDDADRDNPRVHAIVDELLDFVDDRGGVGYRLADVLHEIDPHGCVVPARSAERIKRSSRDGLGRLARLARAYVVDTPAWRSIAAAVLQVASTLESVDERRSLYRGLAEAGVRSWSGRPGEVPQIFLNAVEQARNHRDREADAMFRPFWDWYVSVTEADLRYQEERAREERGE